jgi:hypothetical protein
LLGSSPDPVHLEGIVDQCMQVELEIANFDLITFVTDSQFVIGNLQIITVEIAISLTPKGVKFQNSPTEENYTLTYIKKQNRFVCFYL